MSFDLEKWANEQHESPWKPNQEALVRLMHLPPRRLYSVLMLFGFGLGVFLGGVIVAFAQSPRESVAPLTLGALGFAASIYLVMVFMRSETPDSSGQGGGE